MSFGKILTVTAVSLLCSVMALPQILHSTTMIRMSDFDLARDADAIIMGKVTDTWSEWGENGRYIYTYGAVAVERVIKGVTNGKDYLVKRPGGVIGETVMEVHGTPVFKAGDEVILFLLDDVASYESNVLGWEQGLFNIRDGIVVQNGMEVEEFIARLQSYLLDTR